MTMQQIAEAQVNPEVPINENFDSINYSSVYAKNPDTTTGLTWGYYGGPRWGGFAVSSGTLTLTDNTTNYVVVAIATGVISVSTSTTNWNNDADYVRVYRITTASGAVTNDAGADFDYRAGPGGLHGAAGGGSGAVSSVNGATGAVTLDSQDIEHPDPLNQFGSPSTVGSALEELASAKTFHINGFIEEPEVKTYTLVLKSAYAFTILETTTDAASGSGTATFQIDGVSLGGSANSVSTSESSETHSSANVVSAGNTLTLVMSSIGSPSLSDMSFTIRYTRTLS